MNNKRNIYRKPAERMMTSVSVSKETADWIRKRAALIMAPDSKVIIEGYLEFLRLAIAASKKGIKLTADDATSVEIIPIRMPRMIRDDVDKQIHEHNILSRGQALMIGIKSLRK